MRSHTGEKPYKCTICDKRFHVSSILSTHMRTHDNEKMPCVCDYCGKRYSTKRTVQAHIIATHTGDFPFSCEVCGRGIFTKNGLKMHLITHTDEEAFKCEICHKRFASKSSLKKHITSHAREKKFFNCDHCKKGFTEKKSLESHIAIHTGDYEYSCKVCGKGILSKKNLKQHMTLHTGEKPYRCNLCHKEYRVKCHFEIHKRTHTDIRKRELKVLITRCDKLPMCKNSRQENEMSDQVFGAESFQPSLCMIESASESTTTASLTEFKEPKHEQVMIDEEIVMEDDNECRGSPKFESKVEESFASTLTRQSLQASISSDPPTEEYIRKIENDLSKDNDCNNMRDDSIESARIMTIIGEPFMITDCRVIVKRLPKGKQWKLIGTESEDVKPDYTGLLRQMQSCGQGPRNDTKNSDNPEVLKDVIECEETKQFKDYSLNIEFEAIIGKLIKPEKSEPLDDP
ncbi:hypothetical protein QAD02_018021 [Eretmocerus hayati]|uniref:Uncharacterized protein n=1 Tax=Eretmocerus hayati TaxID=131215 RepID=A0ACC2PG00_9HYME|nr:hypothetical protein QAD02_018021 [Eretmocerus hayati]